MTALALLTYKAGQSRPCSAGSPRSVIRRSRAIRRSRCWPAGSRRWPDAADAQRWARSSTPRRSTWGRSRRLGVVRLGAGDVASVHVCRRPRADDARRPSRSRQSPVEPWRDTRWRSAARHICSPATSTGRAACSRESSAWAAANSNTDSLVVSEAELACWRWTRRRAEAAEHSELALDEIDQHGLHDYATCMLAFAAAAGWRCTTAICVRHAASSPKRCGPRAVDVRAVPYLAVRVRLHLAKVTGRWPNTRLPVTSCARSTTSCSSDRRSAPSSTRCRSSAGSSPQREQTEPSADRRSPRGSDYSRTSRRTYGFARSASGCSSPRTPSELEVGLDLPKARRHVAQRRRRTGHPHRFDRRVAQRSLG